MRVVGASSNFEYGSGAGAAACFLAKLYHASVMPTSEVMTPVVCPIPSAQS
jgi:hypothetical protein